MPQVADPSGVAKTNGDYFMQGMGAIGEGLIKAGENKRADEKQKWLEEMEAAKLEHQKYQDALAQRNNVRDYALRREMYNLNKAKQDYDIGRTTRQDQWLEKIYDQYVGGTDPFESEYLSLKDELSQIPAWQLELLMGSK